MYVCLKDRVRAYAVQYVDLRSEIKWDAKMKELAQLGPHFSKPIGAWDPISQRASANPEGCIFYHTTRMV